MEKQKILYKKKLEEIENIKHRNIICIDFDDCLIPWNDLKTRKPNPLELVLEQTKFNVELLLNFINETEFEPFITSSWAMALNDDLELDDGWETIHYELFNILKQIQFVGKEPFGDRVLAVEVLLENGNRIIGLDDMDYSHYFQNETDAGNFFMINLYNGYHFKNKLEDAKKFFELK